MFVNLMLHFYLSCIRNEIWMKKENPDIFYFCVCFYLLSRPHVYLSCLVLSVCIILVCL